MAFFRDRFAQQGARKGYMSCSWASDPIPKTKLHMLKFYDLSRGARPQPQHELQQPHWTFAQQQAIHTASRHAQSHEIVARTHRKISLKRSGHFFKSNYRPSSPNTAPATENDPRNHRSNPATSANVLATCWNCYTCHADAKSVRCPAPVT